MILLMLIILASGVFTVGKIKGWFDKSETVIFTSGQVKGVVNIERSGIGYTLHADTALQPGDIIETKKNSNAEMKSFNQKRYILDGNSEMIILGCEEGLQNLAVNRGELFGDTVASDTEVQVAFGGHTADLTDAVFHVSVQNGSSLMQIYAGDVSIVLSDGLQERVEAGEYISISDEEDGTITYEIHEIMAHSLNENTIIHLQNTINMDQLAISVEELQQVLDDREKEKKAALEASLHAQLIARKTDESNIEQINDKSTVQEQTEYISEESADKEQNQETADSTISPAQEQNEFYDTQICTITILCNTILDNMENLDDGKEAYVPANGTILATSSVEFEDGETVFEVLKRVCDYAGIQLEYSWTPIYNSYYIEGINHLYEFDCGNESGWMYKVNGWFPNYGCSGYYLEDGDNIVWTYTCNGLGADVGGSNY